MSICFTALALSEDRLNQLTADPSLVDQMLFHGRQESVEDIDLDQTWHGLHYLLTGTDGEGEPPLDFIVSGGTTLDPNGFGLGPVRAFSPAQVRAIDEALQPIDADALAARFDADRMRQLDIYPVDLWTGADEEENPLDYIVAFFEPFKAFVANAASRGLALVVYNE